MPAMRPADASGRRSLDGWCTSIPTKSRSTKSSRCTTTWISVCHQAGSRERKRYQRVAQRLFCNLWMSAGSDHEVLLSICCQPVGHRRGVCAGRELRLPELFTGFEVKAADVGIGGAGDEHHTACGDDGAAEADRAGGNLLLVRAAKILHRAKRDLPADLPLRHVNCREESPGRRAARQIGRRLQEAPVQSVRRTGLVAIVTIFGV